MSTIRVSVLPEQAVAPPVVELVEATGIRSVEQWGFDTYNCGCALRHNDRHWVLCRYHDGMNDGLAMAAAADPTPRTTCIYCNTPITGGIDGCWHDDNGREVCPGESPTTFHEARPPTPPRCPTCGSDNPRWTVGDTPHGRMLLSAFHCPDAWHNGGGAT